MPRKSKDNKPTPDIILTLDDPDPFTLSETPDSPVIITGPHNGFYVPESLYIEGKPLGIHNSCFKRKSPFRRHEACDWGVEMLFHMMKKYQPAGVEHYNYLEGNYSRLITDLNRLPKNSVTERSSENSSIVPGNVDLTKTQFEERIKLIYTPYHNALKALIAKIKEKFGYVVYLDLHSFTPIWQHRNRKVQIGTLSFYDNPLHEILQHTVENTHARRSFRFCPHEPYNLNLKDGNGKGLAMEIEKTGVRYTGLEVRNDLLRTKRSAKKIAHIVHEIVENFKKREDEPMLF